MRTVLPSSGAVHFSTRGEYGVRLMVELARHHGAGPVSLAEMADHEDLPRPYLEQLVVSLREAGLVHSTRGAHGGYELTREPAAIRMGEVLRALEGPDRADGLRRRGSRPTPALCERTGFCNVNLLWVKVRDAVSDALDSITLADLTPPRADAHPFHAGTSRRPAYPSRPIAHGAMRRRTDHHHDRTRTRQSDPTVSDQELVIRDLHVVPVARPEPGDPRAAST